MENKARSSRKPQGQGGGACSDIKNNWVLYHNLFDVVKHQMHQK